MILAGRRSVPSLSLPLLVGAVTIGAAAATALNSLAVVPIMGLVAVALVLLNPVMAVPVLIVASALNRFELHASGALIRFDIIATLLVGAVAANRIAVRTLPLTAFRSRLTIPLLAYAGFNIFSSLLFAHERSRGLKLDAEILAAALTYFVSVAYLQNRRILEVALQALWAVTVAEALFGLLAAVGSFVHASSFGVQPGDFGLPMVYGTQWEANIFGSFLLGNFFVLLGDYLRGRHRLVHSLGLLLVLIGIVLSMTRTVWLALIIGGFIFLPLALRVRHAATRLVPILAAVPVVALVGLIVGSATPFAGRFLDIVNLQTSSAAGRLFLFQVALQEWQAHPIFGLGTGSFDFGAEPGQAHPWLPNLFLLTLHDAGIVGLLALLWLIVAFYRTTLPVVRPGTGMGLVVAGCIAGFTSLLIAFLTTTGFWFAYPWLVVGIGVAARRLDDEAS